MKSRAWPIAVVLPVVVGCVTQTQHYGVSPTVLTQQVLRNVVMGALNADVASQAADTFYMVGSTAVADGRVRVNHPFFSGVGHDGNVAVTGFQAEIASGLAWVIMDYRWVARDGRSGTFARATLVLEPVGDGWRIKHVHSSSAQP